MASLFYFIFVFNLFDDILTGQVTTLAGSSKEFKDGIGSDAKLSGPIGMCLNPHDNCLYVSDFSHKIKKVTMKGIFYHLFSFLI
jgi:hypothetical protein